MDLDQLLDHPHGTFHDSTIERVEIDYLNRTARFQVQICTGDPNATEHELRESSKPGSLLISGLLFIAMEPPDERYPYQSKDGLWISDTEIVPGVTKGTESLPKNLPANASVYQFFVSEWNSFIYIAATHFSFEWL